MLGVVLVAPVAVAKMVAPQPSAETVWGLIDHDFNKRLVDMRIGTIAGPLRTIQFTEQGWHEHMFPLSSGRRFRFWAFGCNHELPVSTCWKPMELIPRNERLGEWINLRGYGAEAELMVQCCYFGSAPAFHFHREIDFVWEETEVPISWEDLPINLKRRVFDAAPPVGLVSGISR